MSIQVSILHCSFKDVGEWNRFVANRIINEYAALIKKHKVDWNIIPPTEFGHITLMLFFGVITKNAWKQAIEDRICETLSLH